MTNTTTTETAALAQTVMHLVGEANIATAEAAIEAIMTGNRPACGMLAIQLTSAARVAADSKTMSALAAVADAARCAVFESSPSDAARFAKRVQAHVAASI